MKPIRVFTVFDICFWGGFCVVPLGLALAATLTRQDPPVPPAGWIILWAAVIGLWLIAALYFIVRFNLVNTIHAVVEPGIYIAWEQDHEVSIEEVQAEVQRVLGIVEPDFPFAKQALIGCLVRFREPLWPRDGKLNAVTQLVSGMQNGMILEVGWRPQVKKSALAHELAHRVLQVYGGDPVESEAHTRMDLWGL